MSNVGVFNVECWIDPKYNEAREKSVLPFVRWIGKKDLPNTPVYKRLWMWISFLQPTISSFFFLPFFFPFYPSRMGNHLYRRLISFLLIENVFIKKCSQIIFFHNTFLLLFFLFFWKCFFFLFSENIFCQDAFNYTLL